MGFDRDDTIIREMRRLGFAVDRRFFATRTDDQVTHAALIAAGAGMGALPLPVAARLPGLVRLLPDLAISGLPVWLAAHEALRGSPRPRVVAGALATGLAAHLA